MGLYGGDCHAIQFISIYSGEKTIIWRSLNSFCVWLIFSRMVFLFCLVCSPRLLKNPATQVSTMFHYHFPTCSNQGAGLRQLAEHLADQAAQAVTEAQICAELGYVADAVWWNHRCVGIFNWRFTKCLSNVSPNWASHYMTIKLYDISCRLISTVLFRGFCTWFGIMKHPGTCRRPLVSLHNRWHQHRRQT